MSKYTPSRGDIVSVLLSPTKGTEQSGHRPFLVLSDKKLNEVTGLIIGCPITSTDRGWSTEVKIDTVKVKGVAVCNQIRTLSFTARKIKYLTKVKSRISDEISSRIKAMI